MVRLTPRSQGGLHPPLSSPHCRMAAGFGTPEHALAGAGVNRFSKKKNHVKKTQKTKRVRGQRGTTALSRTLRCWLRHPLLPDPPSLLP